MPVAFVAGATGYTGRALMQLFASEKTEWKPRPHARAPGKIDGAVVCDPRDVQALTDGMRGCDAVVQLIGTVRARFADGNYDDIDYGTTVALGEAAKAAGVPRLLLLSSVGAGSARGAYLKVKRKTEAWVEGSGLEYTIVRPSVIGGEGRRANQVLGAILAPIPSLRGIEVHELARVFLRALERRDEVRNQILEGKSLWRLLKE
jgi:NADH dehydrogenase